MNRKVFNLLDAVSKPCILLLGVLLWTTIPAWCESQPIGLPSMGATSAEGLPLEIERQLGEAIMAQGRRDPTYLDDPEINQYLTAMGRKLVAFSPGMVPLITLFAVRDPEINAFAMPGGFIGVNSGLVVATQHEAELAAVVAHEIAHVIQRHIARGMTQQKQSNAIMLASVAGALLTALVGGGGDLAMGVAAFGQAATIDRELGFSRSAESEADRVGFQMLTLAGYDPAGMPLMFARLMETSRLNEGIAGGGWATTHPLSVDRMSDIENRVQNLPAARYSDSSDYWYIRAKLQFLQARDRMSILTAEQQFQDEARRFTGVRQSAAYYGLGLKALQRGDLLSAEKYVQQARKTVPANPELARLEIELAFAQHHFTQALSLAQIAWRAWPDRYAIAIVYGKALQQAGQEGVARTFFADRAQQWGSAVPVFYQLLAQSAERAGKLVEARQHMAEYYEAIGALSAAKYQLQQARTLSQDFYVQSKIDVQLEAVEARLQQQRQLLQRFNS